MWVRVSLCFHCHGEKGWWAGTGEGLHRQLVSVGSRQRLFLGLVIALVQLTRMAIECEILAFDTGIHVATL